MTRYAIDAGIAWRLLREARAVRPDAALVGAAALKSQVLALLYRAHRAGEVTDAGMRDLMTRLAELKIRLLGDRASRDMAVRLAGQLGRDEIGPLETLGVGVLQADAVVTDDPELAEATVAIGRIPLADYSDLVA